MLFKLIETLHASLTELAAQIGNIDFDFCVGFGKPQCFQFGVFFRMFSKDSEFYKRQGAATTNKSAPLIAEGASV